MTKDNIEAMLERPYWIVDILPERVPADSPGQYFVIEEYYLQSPGIIELRRKQLGLLLRLNCYYDFSVSFDDGENWTENPAPTKIERWLFRSEQLGSMHTMIDGGKTMAVLNLDDTYMTVYDPTERILSLLKRIAPAEGLFVWR